MPQKFYQYLGIHALEHCVILTESQFEALKGVKNISKRDFITYELGRHDSNDEFPALQGERLPISFEKQGFRLEERIDLLQLGKETLGKEYNEKQFYRISDMNAKKLPSSEISTKITETGGVSYIPLDLTFRGKYLGTQELLEYGKPKIEKVTHTLNERGTEFILFRSLGQYGFGPIHVYDFRNFPFYDNVFFFSLGNFREVDLADILSRSVRK